MSRRLERMTEVIKREVSFFIAKNLDLGRVIATITRVSLSDDLRYANVYFVVIPDASIEKVKKIFAKNIAEIQRALNKRLNVRPVPQIRFLIDKEEEEAVKIEKILDEVSR